MLPVSVFRMMAMATCALALATGPSSAQSGAEPAPEAATQSGAQTAPDAAISLELNGLEQNGEACRVTFVIRNGLGDDLDKAAFEFAIFDAKGVVQRLAVLDFKELPSGKTKVVRFELASTPCPSLSRILVNSVPACTGGAATPDSCLTALQTSTRAEVVFGK